MATALNSEQISALLQELPDWQGDAKGISTTLRFADFAQAMAFMQQVAPGIDERNHHPEWTNVYNRLEITLRTHDADNQVTELDADLARFLTTSHAAFG